MNMDDFGDDFGDDFDDSGFGDEDVFDQGPAGEDRFQEDSADLLPHEKGGLDREEVAFLGAMSEEIAEERRQREWIRREMEQEEKDQDDLF